MIMGVFDANSFSPLMTLVLGGTLVGLFTILKTMEGLSLE